MAHYFDTGILRGTGSWHGRELEAWAGGVLGKDEQISILEAMRRSNMLHVVHKLEIGVKLPNGKRFPIGDKFALMREPTVWDNEWRALRTVAGRYEPLQNERLAGMLESLQEQWPFESVISLKNGQITVVELKMQPFEVGGRSEELHEGFLVAANDHSEGGLFFGEAITRIVCWNTWQLALSADSASENKPTGIVNIPHTAGGIDELAFRVALQERAIEAQRREQEFLEALFNRKVTGEEVNAVIEATLPDTDKGRAMRTVADALPQMGITLDPNDDERYIRAAQQVDDPRFVAMLLRAEKERPTFGSNFELNEKRRKEIAERYVQASDDHPYMGGTAYALFQGITGFTTHSDTFTGTEDKKIVGTLFGQQSVMVNRGRAALAELVK